MQRLANIAGYRVIGRPRDLTGKYLDPAMEELRGIAFRPDWLPENLALKPVQPEITLGRVQEFKRLASEYADAAFADASQGTRRELNPTLARDEANSWRALWGIADKAMMEGLAKSKGGLAVADAYKMASLRTQQAGALRALAATDDVPFSLWRSMWGVPGLSGGAMALGTGNPLVGAGTTAAFATAMNPTVQRGLGRILSTGAQWPTVQNILRLSRDDVDIAGMTPTGMAQDALGPQFDPSLRRPNTHHQPEETSALGRWLQDAWGGASGRTYRRDRPRAGSAPGQ